MAVPPQQRQHTAILATGRIEVTPARQEVMIDDTDHVEAVGANARVGEVEPHQRAVAGGQIHTHHTHLSFAFQLVKIRL